MCHLKTSPGPTPAQRRAARPRSQLSRSRVTSQRLGHTLFRSWWLCSKAALPPCRHLRHLVQMAQLRVAPVSEKLRQGCPGLRARGSCTVGTACLCEALLGGRPSPAVRSLRGCPLPSCSSPAIWSAPTGPLIIAITVPANTTKH